jgi:hypothetical protein
MSIKEIKEISFSITLEGLLIFITIASIIVAGFFKLLSSTDVIVLIMFLVVFLELARIENEIKILLEMEMKNESKKSKT